MSRVRAEESIVVDVQCALHDALTKSKLKRKDFAALLGVSEARVSQMFSDEAPNLTLRTVAAAFHVLGRDVAIKVKTSRSPRSSREDVVSDDLLKLAERCADFDRRLRSIADSTSLSPEGQTRAVALLTTINGDLFAKCSAALAAQGATP